MCEVCEIRKRLVKAARKNPKPCLICGGTDIVGVGTWVPDESTRLAAGGTDDTDPIFAFCLCEEHASTTVDNEKLVTQAILREIRLGRRVE